MELMCQTNNGRDLSVSFKCTCLDERWKGTEIEKLMNKTIYLYGYNDENFFTNVNKTARHFRCSCGKDYTQHWFSNSKVMIEEV